MPLPLLNGGTIGTDQAVFILQPNALVNLATVKSELGLTDTTQDDVVTRLINVASDAIENWCGRKQFPFYRDATTEVTGVSVTWPARLQLSRVPVEFTTPAPAISTDLDPGPAQTVDATGYFLEDSARGWIYSRGRWRTTAIRRPDITQDFDPGTEEETVQIVYTGGYGTQLQLDASNAGAWPGAAQTIASRVMIRPAAHTSQVWICTTGGQTGSVEPTWPTSPTIGATVTDNGVVWAYSGIVPYAVRTLPSDIEQACIDTVAMFYRRRGQDMDVRAESLLGASVTYVSRGKLPQSAIDLLTPYRQWVVG